MTRFRCISSPLHALIVAAAVGTACTGAPSTPGSPGPEQETPFGAADDVRRFDVFSRARSHVPTPFGRVAVVEHGAGPAAVFLHGLPLNGFQWRHQLHGLADIRRCIAIDLLGLGYTEAHRGQALTFTAQADMVLATMDALGIEAFDLVGSDSGGGVAQIVAAKAPQRVRTLALTNSDVHDNWPPPQLSPIHDAAAAGTLAPLFARQVADPDLARAPDALGALAYEDHAAVLSDEVVRAYLAPLVASPERAAELNRFILSQDNAETVAIEDDLERFQAPTLILWGTDDVFFGLEWAYWLRDTIPGADRVVEVEGARLFFAEERPEIVNRELRRHWSAHATPPGAR